MRARLPVVLLGVVTLASACGDDPAAGDDPASTSAPPSSTSLPLASGPVASPPATGSQGPAGDDPGLDGREFLSTNVEGHQLVDGSRIRLTFDGESLGASAGCNSIGSPWSLDGDRLVVAAVAMTEMACEPQARMEQDDWLVTFLNGGPTVGLDGDTLTLSGAEATITLLDREVAEPDRELEGTTWVLEGIIDGDAVSSVPAGVHVPTLDFVGDEVAVDTGCNTGGARFEITADTMTIGPIQLTRVACADEAGNELERVVVRTLEGSPTFTLEADVLTIVNGAADGLVYRAMDSGGPAG